MSDFRLSRLNVFPVHRDHSPPDKRTAMPLWGSLMILTLGVASILLATLLKPDRMTQASDLSRVPVPHFPSYEKLSLSPDVQCSFLVHTFDGYRRYWKPWLHFFKQHHPNPEWPVFFANEERAVNQFFPPGADGLRYHQIKCGKGPWGQRLITALEAIPTKYVLYMQEDMWLNSRLTQQYLNQCLSVAEQNNKKQLKLQAGCFHHHWTTDGEGHPTWYIVSHQPGLWNREYLLSTLRPDMSPYHHEIETNQHLHAHKNEFKNFGCGQAHHLRPFPYVGVSVQGVLSRWGRQMMSRAGLEYVIEPDEIGYKRREETK